MIRLWFGGAAPRDSIEVSGAWPLKGLGEAWKRGSRGPLRGVVKS